MGHFIRRWQIMTNPYVISAKKISRTRETRSLIPYIVGFKGRRFKGRCFAVIIVRSISEKQECDIIFFGTGLQLSG
jgi:hypothetical protein